MTIDSEYLERKRRDYYKQVEPLERAPIADRRAAAANWSKAILDPPIVAERVAWLLAGHYGYYPQVVALQVLSRNGRTNKVAAIAQLVALHEWQCPRAFAVKAWRELSPDKQTAVNQAIKDAIESAKEE